MGTDQWFIQITQLESLREIYMNNYMDASGHFCLVCILA
jgi:hypothetical protein